LAEHQLTSADLGWANLVLVMEHKHKSRIVEKFRSSMELPKIESLEIPDNYKYMDDALVNLIRERSEPHILDFQG